MQSGIVVVHNVSNSTIVLTVCSLVDLRLKVFDKLSALLHDKRRVVLTPRLALSIVRELKRAKLGCGISLARIEYVGGTVGNVCVLLWNSFGSSLRDTVNDVL